MLSLFICNPWESYLAQLEADAERDDAERELAADLEHEHQLGREWLDDPDQDEWPWYAERPYTVQRPQVFRR